MLNKGRLTPERRSRVWRIIYLLLAGLIGIGFCGCMVGPDFVKPEAPEQTEWLQAGDTRVKTASNDYQQWWTAFNDPVLVSLVDAAYDQNLPLQIAGLRVMEARA